MLLLAGIFLTVAVLVLIVQPLVSGVPAPMTDGPDRVAALRELYALRDITYDALRDLEFDFHADKITEADYRDLSSRYKQEALKLAERIEVLEAESPLPQKRRASKQ